MAEKRLCDTCRRSKQLDDQGGAKRYLCSANGRIYGFKGQGFETQCKYWEGKSEGTEDG